MGTISSDNGLPKLPQGASCGHQTHGLREVVNVWTTLESRNTSKQGADYALCIILGKAGVICAGVSEKHFSKVILQALGRLQNEALIFRKAKNRLLGGCQFISRNTLRLVVVYLGGSPQNFQPYFISWRLNNNGHCSPYRGE
jgi:hypothetical protein